MTRKCAETSPQLTHGCTGRQYPCTQVSPMLAQVLLLPIDVRTICLLTLPRSHRETPSANVFATPFTCFARKYHPLRISKHPNIRIKVPDLGSFPPRHLLIQCAAAMLSPGTSTFSPPNRGFEPAPTTNAHAVIPSPAVRGR